MALQSLVENTNYQLNSNFLEYSKFYGNLNKGRSYMGSLIGSMETPASSKVQQWKQQKAQFWNMSIKGNDPKRYYLTDANNIMYRTYDKVPARPVLGSYNYWDVPTINKIDSKNFQDENNALSRAIIKNTNFTMKNAVQRVSGLKDVV